MSDTPSIEKLIKYEALGLIKGQTHPTLPLAIYVYTQFTSFERLWNNVTLACRGLVVDAKGRCVVRCLPKFFNEDEPHATCDIPLMGGVISRAYDKLDGSLIQVVRDNQYGFLITSKGSFTSDQAKWAAEILEGRADEFKPGLTYVFELIHPDNRIVLDYGDRKELVLLAVVETATGNERDIHDSRFKHFASAPLIENRLTHMEQLVEGMVVLTNGVRYKVKTGEYVRLHRIVTEFTPRRVWEALRDGDSLEFENMPEEFQQWLDSTIADIQSAFDEIDVDAQKEFVKTKDLTNKEIGLSDDLKYKGIVFALRNEKPSEQIAQIIWKMIKPKKETATDEKSDNS